MLRQLNKLEKGKTQRSSSKLSQSKINGRNQQPSNLNLHSISDEDYTDGDFSSVENQERGFKSVDRNEPSLLTPLKNGINNIDVAARQHSEMPSILMEGGNI